jgi:monovalent cation:proton antiporter-2 (CPA2) family protein
MASAASHTSFLSPILVFCAAAVIAVPLFRRLGQSGVLGYLAAGVAIGPSGLSLIRDPEVVTGVAELGVVLLLFIVGLELKLSRLSSMKRDILGLGLGQLGISAALVGGVGTAMGLAGPAAFVVGVALALSATSIALQMLEERGDLHTPYGERAFAVLLFQDLAIVAILAVLPLLAGAGGPLRSTPVESLIAAGTALAVLAGAVVVGRYGLNPFFRLLASSGAREVMTASALLVVFGTALLMDRVGLSMAMGAFLAGLLLAESNFRHQLEADIEPFRGILLGLFFMSVGMSIDGDLVRDDWRMLALATPAIVLGKTAVVTALFRATGSSWRDAARAGALLSPAGEFAFVLLPLAATLGVVGGATAQQATALAALTMLVGPVAAKVLDLVLERTRKSVPELPPEDFGDAKASVLVIGFGRFGQVIDQVLLAHGVDVTVIDNNVERIRASARFGFRIYYGDGTRLDILRAAGAARAQIICVCIDDRKAALKIVEMVHQEFPNARTYARAYDRIHAVELMNREVDFQLRETFESALAFSRAMLEELGVDPAEAASLVDDVRKRDVARLVLQQAGGTLGGVDLLRGRGISPEPLVAPKLKPRALNAETREIIGDGDERT